MRVDGAEVEVFSDEEDHGFDRVDANTRFRENRGAAIDGPLGFCSPACTAAIRLFLKMAAV